ncbi:thioredoxin reductase [Fusarium subglutinans]|uniref:Thioredoxin reductase n=1 Tax=Gibberella subglutinans TaxID=42677 RepID=A0A8H5P735_GIBSU|nr:thioredoxin reductase [Fusarium subglutinans]KAF5591248.1 thioredoxin reductase [Fusarium subglutinans]
MSTANTTFDALVIGGGPAGLSVATGLVRQVYKVAVFDSGVYRNAPSNHMHNFAAWDHMSPAEFRSKARQDLLGRYANLVQFVDKQVDVAKKTDSGFELVDADGITWTGRKLFLATGWKDLFPDIPGYPECWAKGIFHCLFCHGYEDRGKPSAGVLGMNFSGSSPMALHLARMVLRLADKAVIYTNGGDSLGEQIKSDLTATGTDGAKSRITVDNRKIAGISMKSTDSSDIVIKFEDGSEVVEGFLAHGPMGQINGPFAEQLGLELTPTGDIKTEGQMFETQVKGVFAVGDCATMMKAVSQAIGMGCLAAGAAAAQLGAELA